MYESGEMYLETILILKKCNRQVRTIDIAKVSPEIAEEDACKKEHVISDETFQGLKRILEDKNII